MLKDHQPVVQDFFSFLKNDLLEVLECLSNREPWQDHIIGYELPEHSEDIEFNTGVMIFMNTASYHEIIMDTPDFYSAWKRFVWSMLLKFQNRRLKFIYLWKR
ncbi:hypothetical protein LG401_18070 [Bacillus pumilus]|uniref:hypothetical protein n=1 Tax=Bacillus TaxID=1386 RepID=UPI001CB9BF4B|nr:MULTISPECIES: hypothetical protein [Bacillus]MCW6698852.1 hypothetical protein [Bacillus sp. RP12]UCZ70899.1 hypothetical protein LG401_18070 [Bacillus pumilus]